MKLKIPKSLKIGTVSILLSAIFISGGFWVFKEDNHILQNISQNNVGRVFGEKDDFPSSWPKEIPIPEGCSLMSSSEHRQRRQKTINLNLETGQSPQEILDFFHTKLEKNNWDKFLNFQLEGGESWVYQKGTRKLELLVWKDIKADKSFISMSLKYE